MRIGLEDKGEKTMTKIKKNLLIVLAVLTVCMFSLAFGTMNIAKTQASAEPKASVAEFVIQNGGSLRIPSEEEIEEGNSIVGIRFLSYITDAYYEDLKAEYMGATEITMKSTVSKVVGQGQTAPAPFEYEWDLTSLTLEDFDSDGIATFCHTINFGKLTGEDIKTASAFEMNADFYIEIENGGAEPVKVYADNVEEVDTTRSMRQVAYMAYTTPSTEDFINPSYQEPMLTNYFTLKDSVDAVQDLDEPDTAISEFAPKGVTVDKIYSVDDLVITDVTAKKLAGESGVFTEADANVGAIKKIVYFDADNNAYPVNLRIVTKVIETEEDLKLFMSANSAYTADLTANIWAGNGNNPWTDVKSRKGYWFLNTDITVDGSTWETMYNHRYFENGVFDGNGHTLDITYSTGWSFGVFGNVYNSIIKNLKLNINAANGKINGNQNRACLLAYSMRDAFFINSEINIEVSGENTTVDKLLLTTEYDGRAGMKNCIINIADGIINENGSVYGVAGNWTVQGTYYDTANCFIFTENAIKDETVDANLNYYYFANVKSAMQAGKDVTPFVNSGLWVLQNNQLIWKADLVKSLTVLLNDELRNEATVQVGETVTVKGSYLEEDLTPALTIVDGADYVSITDNVITALDQAGTATVKATFTVGEEIIEKTITITVKDNSEPVEFDGGAIMLSDVNNKAHLPNGLTPLRITDGDGVVYYENEVWDWSKVVASKTYEIVKKTLYVETATVTYMVDAEIYMGVIASEEDFKWFASTEDTYKTDLLIDHTKYSGAKARSGYWIFANDITVNTNTWSKMYNNRYYENLVLDGNGHTLNINMDTGWSFGIFDKTFETLIKNLHFNITLTNAKLTANRNNTVIFADDMRNSAIVDCLIDISAADTIANPVSELYLMTTYATNICLNNCMINIGDGILAENAAIKQMAGNWEVHGTLINTQNAYFFTNVSGVTANNSFVAKQVSEITETNSFRYTFNDFVSRDWWTYDSQNQTITWGLKTNS